MIKIYTADAAPLYEETVFREYLGKVDEPRRVQVLRLHSRESRACSLMAGYLLQQGVRVALGELSADSIPVVLPPLALEYRYGPAGKPYLSQYPEIFFNISHSGRYVVCAIADREIGVDVQQETPVKARVAERFFTAEENRMLDDCEGIKEWQTLFFRLWTVKESYIKLTGQGLGQGLNSFSIDWREGRILSPENGAFFHWELLAENRHLAVSMYAAIEDSERILYQPV